MCQDVGKLWRLLASCIRNCGCKKTYIFSNNYKFRYCFTSAWQNSIQFEIMHQFGSWHNSHTMSELQKKPVCILSFQNKTESPRNTPGGNKQSVTGSEKSSRCICSCSPDTTRHCGKLKVINHTIGNGAILLLYMCFNKQYTQTYTEPAFGTY